MSMDSEANKPEQAAMNDDQLQDMVAAADTGARNPSGLAQKVLIGTTVAWALFQLWIASPLPFLVGDIFPVMTSTHTRPIHLAFAMFLAFLAYPALKSSPRRRIPLQDWIFAIGGAFSSAYLMIFSNQLADRPGLPTTTDLIVAGFGIVFLLEATRRSLGPPLAIVGIVFLCYVFFGHLAPDVIAWKGASFAKAFSHQWLTQEGVFGIALGVSTSFVFMFVLFGSLLEKAGAGAYFIRIAFAALGHMRGGPAKAAVLSSALTGMISGSSIANVVTTGTFTIPMMKKVGFSAEKAGAVEVASSVNGQIMPPVMGAAAFLMVEYVGISYYEVVTHAFLPAVISYIALLYIVHLEALKSGMEVAKKSGPAKSLLKKVQGVAIGIVIAAISATVIYFVGSFVKPYLSNMHTLVICALVLSIYTALVAYSSKFPDVDADHIEESLESDQTVGEITKTGLHYILPIVVLIWMLIVERKSPGLSAFWASSLLLVTLITQKPLKAMFRGSKDYAAPLKAGAHDLWDGLVAGSRNMIGIGVATATAGIIVGTVSLTGIGQVMAELVEILSGGNLMLMLILVAMISLILGMGLPTTANYIVVSSLMAGVVVELGAQNGLVVPLIAVHMFVFYFGIMADVTPPVGLASFAAAAVSGGDPLKTGVAAFFYSLRTVTLPFIFIFNTDLLLIDVSWQGAIVVFIIATAGMLVFAAATQGYWLAKSKLWESAALILVAFTLMLPGYWLDKVEPAFTLHSPNQIETLAAQAPENSKLRMIVTGEKFSGAIVRKTVLLPMGPVADGATRLFDSAGLAIRIEGDQVIVDDVGFGSVAQDLGIDFDWQILTVETPNDRMAKEVFYIPAFLLLLFVGFIQTRRKRSQVLNPVQA